jgi:dihydrofolate synthase/folylpolyglutamate synthase
MNYQETTDWMFSQLPMYQLQGCRHIKDLTNTVALLNHLDNPQQNYNVHVGGLMKGSTSHMLASILQEAGYK